MRKTEHYQLNQWDATDRILMADFNGDNARLDAALAALSEESGGGIARLDAALTAAENRLDGALQSAKTALEQENQRLDSAKLEFVTLVDGTFTLDSAGLMKIPVNGSAMGQCAVVAVDIQLPSTGDCYVGINGNGGSYWYQEMGQNLGSGGLGVLKSGQISRLVFFPMKRAASPVVSFMAAGGLYFGFSSISYGGISFFQIRGAVGNAVKGSIAARVTGIR